MTKYIFMVFAGACSFGILSTFVKLAYGEGYTAAEISFLQAFTGALVLWVISLLTEKHKPAGPLLPLLGTGAAIGLTTFTYYVSVSYIPASLAIVLLMQFTWMNIVLERLLFGVKAGVVQLAVTGIIMLGTLLAAGLTAIPSGNGYLYGAGYALLSAFLYAVYIVANSRTGQQLPAFRKSALIMTGSALAIVLVNIPLLAGGIHGSWPLLKWAVFLALFGTIIPPVLFTRGIPKIGAGLSGIIMTAELPVAVICAHVVLHEPVNGLQITGIVIMLGAITVLQLYTHRKK